jgi:hypothetical protein
MCSNWQVARHQHIHLLYIYAAQQQPHPNTLIKDGQQALSQMPHTWSLLVKVNLKREPQWQKSLLMMNRLEGSAR